MHSPTPATRANGLEFGEWLKLARPKQWVKNLLVAAAPIAAGVILEPRVLGWTILALVCFCLAASATYMVNDVLDVDGDRAHPTKRTRPVASRAISSRAAIGVAVLLALVATFLPAVLGNIPLMFVIFGYLVLQAAYVLRLKHEAVLDVACIAGGFLLRAIAGGTAANVPISHAFLIVVGFGSLFMAIGKRYSEIVSHDQGAALTRKSLANYTPGYLRTIMTISAAVTLVAYVLWAFEIDNADEGSIAFAALSVIPFTLAMMRYAKNIEEAKAEAPEDVLLGDPILAALGIVWFLLFVGQVLQA